ncbi:MAG: alpha/beta hydrolase [Firmicutes bacterium]|nr:alpha/beta hydrolase [Bacillota bacterium]
MNSTSKILFNFLKLIRFKKRINFINPRRFSKRRIARLLKIFPYTSRLLVDGHLVFTAGLLNKSEKKHIVYFHGGGYSLDASSGHFLFMKKLINKTGCYLSFLDYPLAPEHSANESLLWSLTAYSELVKNYPDHLFILMGDSAGGGLALALSMLIRDEGLKQPVKTILYSPWLDIGLKNKRIKEFEKRDFILDIDKLMEIGEVYRKDLPENHPFVSPKYGDLNNLGDIGVFYGSEEIFYPDCKEITEKSGLVGTDISGYEYKDMQHDWVILPIPEAKKVLEESVELIKEIVN